MQISGAFGALILTVVLIFSFFCSAGLGVLSAVWPSQVQGFRDLSAGLSDKREKRRKSKKADAPSKWAIFKVYFVELATECTKIVHRRSLAIFTADEGIADNSAARTIFTHSLRRRNRGSLAIFFAMEIAHLGASKNRDFSGSRTNAAAAENRAILVHSG